MTSTPTPAEIRADLVEKLQAHHDEMIATVRQRSDAEWRRPPEPGEWSALQQLEHQLLADDVWMSMAAKTAAASDEPDLAAEWAKYRIIEESNPFPPPGDPRTLDELIGLLEERHRKNLEIVASIPDEAFGKRGLNTGWGNLTVIQMLRGVYRHYRMHIDQIEQKEQSFTPQRVQ
ncbi:MAG: DinB family protein [Dehalococcoidia bacterium]